MDKIEYETIRIIKTITDYKNIGGNKWFDEVLKSFGAYYLFTSVCKRDSRLIHAFSEVSGQKYSSLNKLLKEKSIVAERIISKIENRNCPLLIFNNFKCVLLEAFIEEVPNLYNKYEVGMDKPGVSKR